jgi:hypothetical protein
METALKRNIRAIHASHDGHEAGPLAWLVAQTAQNRASRR